MTVSVTSFFASGPLVAGGCGAGTVPAMFTGRVDALFDRLAGLLHRCGHCQARLVEGAGPGGFCGPSCADAHRRRHR